MATRSKFIWDVQIESYTANTFLAIAEDFYTAAQLVKKSIVEARGKNQQVNPDALIVVSVVRKERVIV